MLLLLLLLLTVDHLLSDLFEGAKHLFVLDLHRWKNDLLFIVVNETGAE